MHCEPGSPQHISDSDDRQLLKLGGIDHPLRTCSGSQSLSTHCAGPSLQGTENKQGRLPKEVISE